MLSLNQLAKQHYHMGIMKGKNIEAQNGAVLGFNLKKVGFEPTIFKDRIGSCGSIIDIGMQSREEHKHSKPIYLFQAFIAAFDRGKIYDPFLGSGSVLLAADLEEKTCFGCELDPKNVDVILARWEKATGKKAELSE
jgi:DNA modification methylase